MKLKTLILSSMVMISTTIMGQISKIQVADSVGDVIQMVLDGNYLYFAQWHDSQVQRVDVSLPLPVTPQKLANVSFASGLAKKGNFLYSPDDLGIIKRIDLNGAFPAAAVDFIIGLRGLDTRDIAIDGTDMYVLQFRQGELLKLDMNNPSAIPDTIATGLLGNPTHLLLNGKDLYISGKFFDKIIRIDLAQPFPATLHDLVTGLDEPRGMAMYQNDLYISEIGANRIVKVDLNNLSAAPKVIIDGLQGNTSVATNGFDLYFDENWTSEILKIRLPTGITEGLSKEKIKASPNPSQDFIQISGLNKPIQTRLIGPHGVLLRQTTFIPNQELDISNLPSGIYYLQLLNNDGNVLKFIKH